MLKDRVCIGSCLLLGVSSWMTRWKENGWKTTNGDVVKDKTDFQKLENLCQELNVKWVGTQNSLS